MLTLQNTEENKEGHDTWRDVPYSWTGRCNIVKTLLLNKLINELNVISVKTLVGCCVDIKKWERFLKRTKLPPGVRNGTTAVEKVGSLLWSWTYIHLPNNPAICPPGIYPNEGLCSQEKQSVDIHCNFIPNFITQRNRNTQPRGWLSSVPCQLQAASMTPLIPHLEKAKSQRCRQRVR